MNIAKSIAFSILTFTTAAGYAQSPADDCTSGDDFICSPVNPEDLLAIPGTSLVMGSSMVDEGYLFVTNVDDLTSQAVFPSRTSKLDQDKERFPDCPGPVSAQFRPHGLGLREGESDTHTLYVVGHGEREAIEVFELDASNASAELTWVGCVVAPEGVSLNSVAPLPNGAFATTNFNLNEGGEVWEWQLDAGWSKVPGSDMLGPNGLIASPDGKWLYIGGWQDEALVRLSRGKQPVEKQLIEVGFHIDNVRWGADNTILVAGQKGSRTDIRACLYQGDCSQASTGVALIDEETLEVLATHELPSSSQLIMGTVAINVNDSIWVGGIAGGEYIARFKFSE